MSPETLAYHMHHTLGSLAVMLGWSVPERSYDRLLDMVRIEFDVDDIRDIENTRLLLATSEYLLWTRVAQTTAGFHTISTADGERRDRKQIHDQAVAMRDQASEMVSRIRGDHDIRIDYVRRVDPYNMQPTESLKRWWDR